MHLLEMTYCMLSSVTSSIAFALSSIPSETVSETEKVVSTFGPVGILIWYVWYTTSKQIPSMSKSHNDIMTRLISMHSDIEQKNQEQHKEILDELRDIKRTIERQ